MTQDIVDTTAVEVVTGADKEELYRSHMTLQLMQERSQRLQAENQLLQIQLEQAKAQQEKLHEMVSSKYALIDGDTIDVFTGKLTRVSRAVPEGTAVAGS